MKQPKNNLQAVLYCLIKSSRDYKKMLSTFDLIEMTKHLGISQRVADIRDLGLTINLSWFSHKNQFGHSSTYGKYWIPFNEITKAENIYNKLIQDK